MRPPIMLLQFASVEAMLEAYAALEDRYRGVIGPAGIAARAAARVSARAIAARMDRA